MYSSSSLATNPKTLSRTDYSTPVLKNQREGKKSKISPKKYFPEITCRFSVVSKPKNKSKKKNEESKSQVRARYAKQVMERHQNRKELVGRSTSQKKKILKNPQISIQKIPVKKEDPIPTSEQRGSISTFMQGDIELDNQYNAQMKYVYIFPNYIGI